jgi:hypothetical protein
VPFDIPHLRAENGPAQNHVRIGWLRSVANIYHAFAHAFAIQSIEFISIKPSVAMATGVSERDASQSRLP